MESEDFRSLLSELTSGDNGKLKTIFEQHAVYCISKLQADHNCSRQDAEDIYTDAVLNFRDKVLLRKIDSILDLRAYLYGTCKNMLLVSVKKNQRVTIAAIELTNLNGQHNHQSMQHENADYQEELLKLTEEALSTIPEPCRQILKLFYFDKLSLEEISLKLNLANANVAKVSKSRCFRKLMTIVKQLQQNKNKYETIK
jgi:RNA polymerase sigma factor (sigma-70 family)